MTFVDADGTALPEHLQSKLRQVGIDPQGFADGDLPGWDATVRRFVPTPTETSVRDAGRWEVIVDGSPPVAVTDEDETDWLYGWITGA